MADKIIEFIYDDSLQKQPMKLQKKEFVLYSPNRIKLQPGELTNDDIKLSVNTPQKTNVVSKLLSKFTKDGLCMESYQNVPSSKSSIRNTYQLSAWKIHF